MEYNVAAIIKKSLLETGKACIPGVGMLTLKRSSSVFNRQANVISPPRYEVSFEEKNDCDNTLPHWVASSYKIPLEEATKAVNKLEEDLVTAMGSSLQSYYIDGIGSFYMINNKTTFIPSHALKYWFTEGLPEVTPVLVKKTSEVTSVVEFSPMVINKRDKSSSNLWKWIPFLLLLTLFTLIVNHYINRDHSIKKSSDIHIEIPVNKDPYTITKDSSFEDSRTTIPDIDEEPLEEEVTISQHKTRTYKPLQSISDKKEIINPSPIYHEGNEECVIITGYFTDPINASKMKELLAQRNYKVYTELIGAGERVGIQFDCQNQDLRQEIRKIRDSIAREAWYLVPSLKVQ